jgi:hypothetical protein
MMKMTLWTAWLIFLALPASASLLPVYDGEQLTIVRDDGRVILIENGVTDVASSTHLVAYRKRGRLRLIDREGKILFLADQVEHYEVGDEFLVIRKKDGQFQMVSGSGRVLVCSTGIMSFRLIRISEGSDFVIVSRGERSQVVTSRGHVVSIRKRRARGPRIGIVVKYPSR